MTTECFILLIVMFLGVASHNALLVRASAILLVISVMGWSGIVRVLEKDGLDLGILLLTIAVLSPLASGSTGLKDVGRVLTSKTGVASLVAGALAAVLTAQGVGILRSNPEIIMGLALGSIAGAAFLGGVPAGPLVAAGFAAVFVRLLAKF